MGVLTLAAIAALAIATFSSCSNSKKESAASADSTARMDAIADKQSDLKPAGPDPAWAPDIDDEMQVVIEKLASYGTPPLNTLPVAQARKAPSPADATMAVMTEHNIPMPPNKVDTMGKDIPVSGGKIHLRIYTPNTGKAAYPVIVYYHGGGWVIANLDTYNASAQGLANQVEAVVVSVAYRQAPEYKFPTAHKDSYAAYEWTVKNAASLKGDPKRIAVVGESAGGNLATAVSMMARDKGLQLPVHEVLVYPIAGYNFGTESYRKYADAKPLNAPLMKWFFEKYLTKPADGKSPMISLVSANLKGLPATTIIAAEIDPLQSEGELLADNLKKAGVSVTYKLYKGVTHEFFGMAAVVPDAKDAEGLATDELKKAFGK